MALIDETTAQEIWKRSKLQPGDLGKRVSGEPGSLDAALATIYADITSDILPGAQAKVEVPATEAADPYDFPLDVVVIQSAKPRWNAQQCQEHADSQMRLAREAVIAFGAAMLRHQRRPVSGALQADPEAAASDAAGRSALTDLKSSIRGIVNRAVLAEQPDDDDAFFLITGDGILY